MLDELEKIDSQGKYLEQSEHTLQILCFWCGRTIRNNREGDSFGICMTCFYRMFNGHLRAQRKASNDQFTSER